MVAAFANAPRCSQLARTSEVTPPRLAVRQVLCSAKSGIGIDDILRMVCKIIPSPNDRRKEPLRYPTLLCAPPLLSPPLLSVHIPFAAVPKPYRLALKQQPAACGPASPAGCREVAAPPWRPWPALPVPTECRGGGGPLEHARLDAPWGVEVARLLPHWGWCRIGDGR
jgi:hypothetical protein